MKICMQPKAHPPHDVDRWYCDGTEAKDTRVRAQRLRYASQYSEVHYGDCAMTRPELLYCDCTASADIEVVLRASGILRHRSVYE